jgi:hypothetical protein
MYSTKAFTKNLYLCVSYIFPKFDGSWKMKVWHSLWYHPIILCLVCKFQNSLYGLKQYPCEWNYKINAYFAFEKFKNNFIDHNVYFKRVQKNSYVIITLHLDDLILTFNDLILLKEIKDNLSKNFKIVHLNEI